MQILFISFIGCIVFLLAAAILIVKRQPKKQDEELIRLSETLFTAVMGGMMIALGFILLYMKYIDSTIAGTDETSYFFIAGFAAICVVSGCGIMLYTFLKKIIAYDDKVLCVTMLGQYKEIFWDDITQIKVPFLSNKATFITEHTQFTAGGAPRAYKEFVKIAQNKTRSRVGNDVFNKLLNRLMA